MSNIKYPDLMLVADYVKSEDDINQLTPWGENEEFLVHVLEEVGFNPKKVNFSFVVKTFETVQKFGRTTVKEPSAKTCSESKLQILAEIKVYQPKVVLLMGTIPLKAVLNETGITSKRGSVIEIDSISYIPTFKPELVVKNDLYLEQFLLDLELAYRTLLGEKEVVEPVNYVLVDTTQKLLELTRYSLDQKETAIDLETSSLSPFQDDSQIVCVIFSFIERETFIVPLYSKYQIFKDKELDLAKSVVRGICESPLDKIGHNFKFDIKWLKVTEGIEVNGEIADSMYSYWLLNEETGVHGLDYLCWRFVPSMGGYWSGLEKYQAKHKDCDVKKGGSYRNLPWDILTWYGGCDGDVTLRCHHKMLPLLKNL